MTRFTLPCALALIFSMGAAFAQTAPKKPYDPKAHALWFANYAFDYAKKDCPTLLSAELADDRVATIAECLSKDGKTVSKYRINMGDNMFAVPIIELISTTPK